MTLGARVALALALGCPSLGACGDDQPEEQLASGTCDMTRSSQSPGTCTEWKGPERDEAPMQSSCDEQDGEWSDEPCPETERRGCCSYEGPGAMRRCYYVGLEADARTTCHDVYEGVWTAG
jgi:hypothetical protein